ncbi:Uncharacterised protein [uncultured archaeon]|nr:Uncharacterised protein [uncultured archaeon]
MARGETMNLSLPRKGSLKLGSSVQLQTRKRYSTVKTAMEKTLKTLNITA